MNEKYKAELVAWAVRAVIVILLTLLAALVQRWVGVPLEVPPPPPVTVIVETPDGGKVPAYRVEPKESK